MARSVKIVQAAVGEYVSLLQEKIAPMHARHAARLGYSYEVRLNETSENSPFWMKPPMIIDAINQGFDLVVWLDADAIWLGDQFDVQFPTVFGMTEHVDFGHYGKHFNAGVIYVNNLNQTIELLETWYGLRDTGSDDQPILNACAASQITKLDHAWNSTVWIPFYRSLAPKVVAWHGCPDRISRIANFISEAGL